MYTRIDIPETIDLRLDAVSVKRLNNLARKLNTIESKLIATSIRDGIENIDYSKIPYTYKLRQGASRKYTVSIRKSALEKISYEYNLFNMSRDIKVSLNEFIKSLMLIGFDRVK